MAQREGQGLQITVIVIAMFTIILAITTYVFYVQASSAQKEADTKAKALSDQQATNNKLMYRVLAMKHTLGLGGVTMEEVKVAQQKAGGEDTEAKEVLDNYAQDMATIGDQAAPEGPKNYRSLAAILLRVVAAKNASLADANEQIRKVQSERDAVAIAEKGRADEAIAAMEKAKEDLKGEQQKFTEDRGKIDEEKQKLVSQVRDTTTTGKTAFDNVQTKLEAAYKQIQMLTSALEAAKEQLKKIQKGEAGMAEPPDGRITHVSQSQRLVWINVGRADGLLRQTTFSVYEHNDTKSKSKGRIEVITLGERESEARILEDTPGSPMIPGDDIRTPAWAPGQRIHFAMAMKMDINKDGVDDYEMVKNIILMNGGIIDAELTPQGKRIGDMSVNTRYFILGQKIDETTTEEVRKQFTDFESDRIRNGVDKMSVDELLSLMGWKAEERTHEMGGSRSGMFRKPAAKTAPAAGQPASAGEAPATAPGAPATAPADPFAPAATTTDPFAPKPDAKPAGPVEDPFGAAKP